MDQGSEGVRQSSSSEAKIALFRSLFRGREDVYPRRFESHADAMIKISQGRSANPLAKAIAGRALILAGLLLLRRP